MTDLAVRVGANSVRRMGTVQTGDRLTEDGAARPLGMSWEACAANCRAVSSS